MKEKLQAYLDSYLKVKKTFLQRQSFKASAICEDTELEMASCGSSIDNYIENNQEKDTFQTKLFHLIDQKNLKDSEVYNKVNIDRRLFSKIRSSKNYHPKKETIILLGIALELSEDELEELLKTASYSLPMNTTYDLIIRFCFKEKIYDIDQINGFLYDHNCKLLLN